LIKIGLRRGLQVRTRVPSISGKILYPGDSELMDISGRGALVFTLDFFKDKYIENYVKTHGCRCADEIYKNIEQMKRYFILVLMGYDDYDNYMSDFNKLIQRKKKHYDNVLRWKKSAQKRGPRELKAANHAYKKAKDELDKYKFHEVNMRKYFKPSPSLSVAMDIDYGYSPSVPMEVDPDDLSPAYE
jgi:hypothetical protein